MLTGYSDSDLGSQTDDRKSTGGVAFYTDDRKSTGEDTDSVTLFIDNMSAIDLA